MPVPSRRRSAATRALLLTGGLVTAAALALAGCADPDDGASPSTPPPGGTSSPEETPSPSPSTYPDDRATNGTTTLESPTSGAVVAGPTVTVSGTATAFEATLAWEVVPAGGGDPVQEGTTMAGANGEIGPFSFTVDLEPGTWTVRVWEPDVSDGEGSGDERLVSATFTVE